jgi:type II secretory pathway component PulF
MRRKKNNTTLRALSDGLVQEHRKSKRSPGGDSFWEVLTKPRSIRAEIPTRDLTFILKNLAMLTENGVSLPKALNTLAAEKALDKHRGLLQDLRRRLENGESFSYALSQHRATFDTVMISQVKVGERTGTIPDTLRKIAEHREKAGKLRADDLCDSCLRDNLQRSRRAVADGHAGAHCRRLRDP